jgi:hypothetical protein
MVALAGDLGACKSLLLFRRLLLPHLQSMKALVFATALISVSPSFAAAPFSQASITLPDGTQLVKDCKRQDTVTPYRLEVAGRINDRPPIDVGARPNCPATVAIVDSADVIHVVLGFTGHDRAQTLLDVGDSNTDLMQMKGMELRPGESKTTERDGIRYRVTRLR